MMWDRTIRRRGCDTLAMLGAVCGIVVGVAGCANRAHMRNDYGEQTRRFQERQRVYAEAAEPGVTGLDSEEAAIIHDGYRKQLGDDSASKQSSSREVMILGESGK